MKRFGRRVLTGLLAAVLLFCLPVVHAADDRTEVPLYRLESGQAAAEQLYALGLMRGSAVLPDGSPDFALTRTLNRLEAMVLIVRLLGGEQEALEANYAHPFDDVPQWGAPYVGYAYHHGISNGLGKSFGAAQTITLNEFLTQLLRSMGYRDVNWLDPYPLAGQLGLYYPTAGDGFFRADAAVICLDALNCPLSPGESTLFDLLKRSGAVSPDQEAPAGVFVPGPVPPLVAGFDAEAGDGLLAQMYQAVSGHAESIAVRAPEEQLAALEEQLSAASGGLSSPFSDAAGLTVCQTSGQLQAAPAYLDTGRVMAWLEGRATNLSWNDLRLLESARSLHASLVTPDMSEYDQVKAFHDWLALNVTYDPSGDALPEDDALRSATGALLDRRASSDGFARAFDLLCYFSGIDCLRVTGASGGGFHAWNKVKLGGQWYAVDAALDCAVSSASGNRGVRYDYFLISDGQMARDHSWTQWPFWPAAAPEQGSEQE